MSSSNHHPGSRDRRPHTSRWIAAAGCIVSILCLALLWTGWQRLNAGLRPSPSPGASHEGNPETADTSSEPANHNPAQVEKRLLKTVRDLASDEMEGRGIYTEGVERAARYIAGQFRLAGLKSDHYDDSPFQCFGGSSRWGLNGPNCLAFRGPKKTERDLILHQDFTPLSLSSAATFELPIAFAGYGITAPERDYDDYAGIDVSGKAVLILRHQPPQWERVGQSARAANPAHAHLATKAANAVDHGAAAVFFITDAHALRERASAQTGSWSSLAEPADLDQFDRLLAFTVRGQRPANGVPVMHLRRRCAEAMIREGTSHNLVDLEEQINRQLEPKSHDLQECTVRGDIHVGRIERELKNVLATLETVGPLSHEAILLGAHYDHIGYGSAWTSLAPGRRAIHNGADDNASGVAVMLEIARQLADRKQPLARRLVFVAFTAEESGLIGSQYYVEHPLIPLDDTVAMLNFDMVGYLRNSRLEIYGVDTAAPFPPLLARLGRDNGFELLAHPGGYGPSDHASFAERGVPVLHFFTGLHDHYHRPTDDYDRLNYRGMRRITSFARELIIELSNSTTIAKRHEWNNDTVELWSPMQDDQRAAWSSEMGLTGRLAVDGSGYTVLGVLKGGLAHQSGIREGDRIVQIESRRILTEQDYSDAVSALQRGRPTPILLLRGDVELEITLRPE